MRCRAAVRFLLIGGLISAWAAPASAQIALVNHAIAQGAVSTAATTSPVDMTLGGGATMLAACVSFYGSGTIADSSTNTWVCPVAASPGGSSGSNELCYVANPTVTSTQTFSYSGANTYSSIAVLGFSGVATVTPFDQQNSGTGTGAVATGSVTPTSAGQVLVSCLGGTVVSGVSVDSGQTLLDTAANNGVAEGIASAYEIQTTVTTRDPTFTVTVSGSMGAVIGTFKAAGGGPSPSAAPRMLLMGVGP